MARTTVKSTYSLDLETVHKLDALATRWHVSKSEVLRRAIDLAAREQVPRVTSPLEALDELQKSIKLSKRQIESWAIETRHERVKSSMRHEWRKL